MPLRFSTLAKGTVMLLAAYGALHLTSIAFAAGKVWPKAPPRPTPPPLTPHQQPLVSALARLLHEEGVPEPARWAAAIVRSSPTDDLGYLALVTAQIRRESHFLAPDLEWLYQRVVPELVHELGVEDPIRTIGPMQVQRWRLHSHFEQALGARLDRQNVRALSLDVETGVAACVAVLDRIVLDHAPDRRLTGWVHEPGPAGLHPELRVLASDFAAPDSATREEALRQKLASDLSGEPLALDGVAGDHTAALLTHHPEWHDLEQLRSAWQQRFGVEPPQQLAPRIAHDPQLALVLADFHSGRGSCRTAALQALCNDLCGTAIACDGKWGPLTAAALPRLVAVTEADANRRDDFLQLLAKGQKRSWIQDQLLDAARRLYRQRHGRDAPAALVPDLWFDGPQNRIKGLGRISVAGYVAGSVAFFEDYLKRLSAYTGAEPPGLPGSR